MKTIKGVKKAVSELKDAQYGRIYFDKESNSVVALSCISSQSGQLNDPNLLQVCSYNSRFDNLSMKWIQEEVEEYLHYHRISK